MAQLTLILTNFFERAVGARPEQPARLPALELLLARAERERLSAGWRGWLAGRLAVSPRWPPAELAALAFDRGRAAGDAVGAPGHHWLATPLHFFAGIDSVHLHPEGVLQLSGEEQQRLATEFTRVIGGSRWRLSPIGQRELLLGGPPLYASADDPLQLLSRAPDACMARGPDANALRRLGSEIELWLHEHPLNLERLHRGQLPITGLWLWGGALGPPQPQAATGQGAPAALYSSERPMPLLYGRDTYTEALWQLRAQPTRPLPQCWQEAPLLSRPREDQIVLLPLRFAHGLSPALLELERLWLAPAIQAVRRRRLTMLYVLLAGEAYRLTWRHCIRVWRARAPWWEELR